jgi:hypothetical protein
MGRTWRRLIKYFSLTLTASLLISGLSLFTVPSAQAAPVTATGTNPSICNQEVGDALNVVAYRLSGGDCVIEFKNTGSTTWTVPAGITAVNVLVVGGGGGGGSRAAGGGGGGGFAETTNYLVTAGNIHAITVGAGGPGAASSSAANGSAGTASSFLRSAEGLTANGGAEGLDHLSTGRGGASGSATGTGAVSSNAGGAQLGSGNCAGNWCGGGGGGAGAVGANAVTTGGVGGNGRASSITGTPITYAGGGGGGSGSNSNPPTPGGAGGSGGGGAGRTSTQFSCTSEDGTSGSANLGGGGGGAGYCITPNSQGTGGSGGSGVVIISYTADTTAPSFTSSASFTMAENSVVGINAALFIASETVTITITSGADTAIFNLITASSNSAVIRFKVSPNYEAPSDVGLDNIYNITIRATDTAGNFVDQAITVTVTDVVDTSSFNSLILAGSATTATFRTAVVITANITVASRVTFRVNGKVLPGCKNRLANGSGSSFSVTCSWRPSNRGTIALTAAAIPTGAGISSTIATPVSIMVGKRVGSRS